MKERTMVCNNLIDAKKIIKMSEEKVPEEDLKIIKKNNDCKITTFINLLQKEKIIEEGSTKGKRYQKKI